MSTLFNQLQIRGWRQFEAVSIDFNARLTIITGANGAGKTTLLSLLTQHFGWQTSLIAVPRRDKSGMRSYLTGWRPWKRGDSTNQLGAQVLVGELWYSPEPASAPSGSSQILIPADGSMVFNAYLPKMQPVHGVYLASHRIAPGYGAVNEIPTDIAEPSQLIDEYEAEIRHRTFGIHSPSSPGQRMKRTLISLGAFSFGNEVIRRDRRNVEVFRGFVDALRAVLPASLGFQDLEIDPPEVLLVTSTGTFTLDSVSGGIGSLIDTTWRIYMRSLQNPRLCVVIDEPENHLHPAMQRALLPSLLKAFPLAQFVAATHNPFIVGSVQDSNVYVLNYDDAGRVSSHLLDTANRAGTSNEILRDVLGLEFTIPLWVEDRLQASITQFRDSPLSERSLAQLRSDMAALGIEHLFPETLAKALGA